MINVDNWSFIVTDSHTSKGNQLKWRLGEVWCKADYLGYEGMAEYVASTERLIEFGKCCVIREENINIYGIEKAVIPL